jgi:hypothetical protein
VNPGQHAEPEAQLRLDADAIEVLAARIAELLAARLAPQRQTAPQGVERLLSAAEVSEWWGVRRGWVYQHAAELGALRIGDGERPRLRFDAEQVARCLDRAPATPPDTPPVPGRRVRRSPRIRGDSPPLAFRTDPELSSLKANRRWPGGARTPPAAA